MESQIMIIRTIDNKMTERKQNRKTTGLKDNRIVWASRAHGLTYNTWQKDYRLERQQNNVGK